MKRLGIFLSVLFFIIPTQTRAIICSNENKVKYQTLASNITTSYTYTEENGTISFQITLSNIAEGFIIKDVKNGVTYPYQGNELTIYNLQQNTGYRFDVYTNNLDCHLETLYSHYISTPSYNPYYQDEICKGMESHSVCQKWAKMTLTYEEFRAKVESLKQIEEKPVIELDEEEVKGFYDYLLEFYIDYYYIVLPVFIVGGIVVIYRYNKKNDLF